MILLTKAQIAVAIAAGVLLFASSPKSARSDAPPDFVYAHESFKDSSCSYYKRADPVGILFYGPAAYPYFFYNKDFPYHTGLRVYPDSDTQYFYVDGYCQAADSTGNFASNLGVSLGSPLCAVDDDQCPHSIKRYHVRSIWNGRNNIMMTPHYDVPCGRIGHRITAAKASNNYESGYDFARRKVQNDFRHSSPSEHPHEMSGAHGNTVRTRQCGGELAGGNGDLIKITVG